MAEIGEVRLMVLLLVRCIVDRPDEVSVEAIDQDGSTLLQVQVAPGEAGKIIGKGGRTARSLRQILAAASLTAKRKICVNLQDGRESKAPQTG